MALAKFRIEAENQSQQLGMAWVILKPLLNAAIFGFMFGILMRSADETPDFLVFLLIGVFLFEAFASSLTNGARSITSNRALVQSLAFPRMALPISVVTQRFRNLMPTLVVLALILVLLGHPPKWEWLAMVPLVALYYVFCVGMALITARLVVHFRDLVNFLPFITRFFFYTTGIFFVFDLRFADYPSFTKAMEFQPVYAFLSLSRELLLDSDPLYDVRMQFWPIIIVWTLVVLVFGVIFFWAAEERYGRVE